MYADAGIKLDFDIVDTAALNRRRGTGEYEIAGRLYPAVNPDTLLFGYLHPDNIVPQGLNGAKYSNPTLTAKLEAARAETNVDKRKALYAEVEKIAMTDLPYLPMYVANVYWAAYPWVHGVTVNKLAEAEWYPVKIEAHG
jgi:peptide/nickel transport system substrate-binding protein